MSIDNSKPWLALYDAGQPTSLVPEYTTGLAMFMAAVERAPNAVSLRYFDGVLTFRQVDEISDRLACLLATNGFQNGDRLALYMQNIPQFVIALVAGWKAGGIVVPINPMNRARELSIQLADCQAQTFICEDNLYRDVVMDLDENAGFLPRSIFTTSSLDFQFERDTRLFKDMRKVETPLDLFTAMERCGAKALPESACCDTAFLVYTSGTTGLPKGAIIAHDAVTFNAQTFRDWVQLPDGTSILAVAPLFHITGLIGHIGLAFLTGSPLLLSYRFEPGVMLDMIEKFRPGFTVGAITVFIALLNHPGASRERLSSLTKIYSGGAPVPLSVVEGFREKFGHYIRNAYGLTESAAPTHLVPLQREAAFDPKSGAVSIGVPVYNVRAWIAQEDGEPAPPGVEGELVIQGPMISRGYWNKPEETTASMQPDGFRTGDIAVMDANGWFYIVDRKKDMIISSGYKVWPREVEDVLYGHSSVREAAVVPIPHPYRGETVRAVVSLKPGMTVTADELIGFCRERMAAYKYPREVVFMDELPKTASGKILRRELR
jgi:long-chain acyl-CoA synthetase